MVKKKTLDEVLGLEFGIRSNLLRKVEFDKNLENSGSVLRAIVYGFDFSVNVDIYDKTRILKNKVSSNDDYQVKLQNFNHSNDSLNLSKIESNEKACGERKTNNGYNYAVVKDENEKIVEIVFARYMDEDVVLRSQDLKQRIDCTIKNILYDRKISDGVKYRNIAKSSSRICSNNRSVIVERLAGVYSDNDDKNVMELTSGVKDSYLKRH